MDFAHVYISPNRGPWRLASGEPRTYRKELIYVGKFVKDDGKSRQEFTVDEALLHHWTNTFAAFKDRGIDVPLPVEHTDDPEKRRGSLVGAEVALNDKGLPALFGVVTFRDAEAEKLAATASVSLYVPPKFVDGKGNTYYRPIRHVALTDYPVIPGLGGFEAIAASLVGDRTMKLSLAGMAEKMGIPVADKDEPSIEAEIVSAYQSLQQQVEQLQAKIAELEGGGEGEGEGEPAAEEPVAAGFINLARDNRRMKLDAAVQTGLLTPAARKKVEAQYCTDQALTLSLRGKTDDGFDALMDTLRENGAVLSFKERTGAQTTVLPDGAKAAEKGTLAKDAERRAEEAAKQRKR